MHPDPKSRTIRILAALALTAAAALVPVAQAAAAQGSVPTEVTRYAEDPEGLLARLDDLFGVTASGQGIELDDTTETGTITRAWVFTAGYLRGDDPETAVELANLWTVPILIDEKPVGVATIWINPTSDAPDLADFVVGASDAKALSEVPVDAQLVRDEARGAWFTLIAGKLHALVPGTSGVTGSTTLGDYQATAASVATAPPQDTSGLVGGVVLLTVGGLAIAGLLVLPRLTGKVREARAVAPTELPKPAQRKGTAKPRSTNADSR